MCRTPLFIASSVIGLEIGFHNSFLVESNNVALVQRLHLATSPFQFSVTWLGERLDALGKRRAPPSAVESTILPSSMNVRIFCTSAGPSSAARIPVISNTGASCHSSTGTVVLTICQLIGFSNVLLRPRRDIRIVPRPRIPRPVGILPALLKPYRVPPAPKSISNACADTDPCPSASAHQIPTTGIPILCINQRAGLHPLYQFALLNDLYPLKLWPGSAPPRTCNTYLSAWAQNSDSTTPARREYSCPPAAFHPHVGVRVLLRDKQTRDPHHAAMFGRRLLSSAVYPHPPLAN